MSLIPAADGAHLWTDSEGEGPLTILLSNGGPGCCDYLQPLAGILEGPGRRIVRWEQRGTGRSTSHPDDQLTVAKCLADMEAIRAASGIERWVVAGHSWGADLSLIYALEHPERCAGLIAVSGGRLNNDREWHAAYRQGVAEDRETHPDFAYPPNMEVNRRIMLDFKRYIQQPTLFRELTQLEIPALFLYGAEDIRPSWPVEQVAALLPNGQFALIPGADHYGYQTHASEFRTHADQFLRGVL